MKKISKSLLVLLTTAIFSLHLHAESWDYIRTSGEYYYGIGIAATDWEADKLAMAELVSQIATNVSSDFTRIDDATIRNGKVDHNSRVHSCIKTYSQSTLTNTEKWGPEGKAPNITVRRYMKKSELSRIFDNRIAKAKGMLQIASECLEHKKVDMALQYYYWAYSLIRSLQFPNEVKDQNGRILVDWIPVKIDEILSDINVKFLNKTGDYIDLFFTYKGEPVSTLEFSYSDGRAICQGLAKEGYGTIEMIPGDKSDVYHLDIEYEYKSQSRGDAEMESVLAVITPRSFPKASVDVKARFQTNVVSKEDNPKLEKSLTTPLDDQSSEVADNTHGTSRQNPTPAIQNNIVAEIAKAISSKSYSDINRHFTIDGLQMFNRLTNYGTARILDDSKIRTYKGIGNRTITRGLRMSFSFNGRRKKTFVEDVSFTFNADNKIENVAFGVGDSFENSIFNNKAKWSPEVREIIASFMENYKTAYCLERLDYLREIFADDAVIIVGNVIKPSTSNPRFIDNESLSPKGHDIIKYNHYTKAEYIKRLAGCFNRNDFINLKFTSHQIQWLEKFENETIFAINIRQQYNSTTYADDGYLFLLVDMTNREAPLIKIRTWQPNEVSIDKLYNAGDFFND